MADAIQFIVNGREVSSAGPPDRPLLEVLREDLGLTGAKYGCGEGSCRACTVLVDGAPRASCTLEVGKVSGATILTIEGVAEGGTLHAVQEAFIAEGAMQCGYCVPGMILGAIALLRERPQPAREEVEHGMQRHLCRCCNYPNIVNAVLRAAGNAVPRGEAP